MENFYIIKGNDKALIEEKRLELIHEMGITEEENVTNIDFMESDFNEIIIALSTYSFFSDKLCVVVNNINEKKIDERILEDFYNYLKNPILEHFLIFEIVNDKINLNLFNNIKKYGKLVQIEDMTSEKVDNYATKFLDQKGIKYDLKALSELLDRCEHKYDLVKKELEKIEIYFLNDENKHLKIEDVYNLIPRNLEENIYILTNYILEKNKTKALETLNDLLINKEDSIRLLNIITRRIKEIIYTKELMEKNYSKEYISEYFGISSGKAYYLMKDCNKFNKKTLEKYFSELIELDYKIKSGQIDKNIGLELFILGL